MSDFVQVLLVGNLKHDLRSHTDPETGMVYGSSVLCVGKTSLVQGEPVTRTLDIPIEIHGQSRISRFRQQFGAGSRLLCQGTMIQRSHPTAGSLRVVVETVFTATICPAPNEPREPDLVGSNRSPVAVPQGEVQPTAAVAAPSDATHEHWRTLWEA